MAAYVNNLVINAGSDFSQSLSITAVNDSPINLTGYSASAILRKHSESSNEIARFGINFVDRSSGKIVISLGSTVTTTIKEGRYVYDVMLTDPALQKSVVVEGMVLVRTGITS